MYYPHKIPLFAFSRRVLTSEMGQLCANAALLQFASSLVAVFIPIYLVESGFSLTQALLFFALHFGASGLLSPLAAAVGARLGFKRTILLHTPLRVLYLLWLGVLPAHHGHFYWLAVFAAVVGTFYWIPLHSLFARASHDGCRGNDVGRFTTIMKVATIAGPILGGAAIVLLGYGTLFAIAAALIVFSAVPLFFTKDVKCCEPVSLRRMASSAPKRFVAAFTAEGALSAASPIVWPLFIFAVLGSEFTVGSVATISGVGIAVFTLYTGVLSDRVKKTTLLHIGGLLWAATWFMRPLALDLAALLAVGLLDGLVGVLVAVPFGALFYSQAMKAAPDEFIVLREMCLGVGRVAYLLALVALLPLVNAFTAGFVLAGMAALVFVLF